MWTNSWKYKEGFAICAGLFITGTLLQLLIGHVNTEVLHYPFNIYVGVFYIGILILIGIFSKKVRLVKWFTGYEAALTALLSFAILVVIMGLIPQVNSTGKVQRLGFTNMLSAWPFVLIFVYFISIVGLVTFQRLIRFRTKDIPFLLNHGGLFLALTGAILGNGDLVRLRLTSYSGKPEWRAVDNKGKFHSLPLAIELTSFTIDEYPPKLMAIDNETGSVVPHNQPHTLLVEDSQANGEIMNWKVKVSKFIPSAAQVIGKDTVNFVAYHSIGATTAVYVVAENKSDDIIREGWISCGSFMFPYKALRLNEQLSVVMPEREPRKFSSDVKVYTQAGQVYTTVIEVNRPFSVEGWKIYQLSYDESKGKWSDFSVFELVKDPWLPIVYAGLWMMITGAVCMFFSNKKRKCDD